MAKQATATPAAKMPTPRAVAGPSAGNVLAVNAAYKGPRPMPGGGMWALLRQQLAKAAYTTTLAAAQAQAATGYVPPVGGAGSKTFLRLGAVAYCHGNYTHALKQGWVKWVTPVQWQQQYRPGKAPAPAPALPAPATPAPAPVTVPAA